MSITRAPAQFLGRAKYSVIESDGLFSWPSAPELISVIGVDNSIYDSEGAGKTFASKSLALSAMLSVSDDTYVFAGEDGVIAFNENKSVYADKINKYVGYDGAPTLT